MLRYPALTCLYYWQFNLHREIVVAQVRQKCLGWVQHNYLSAVDLVGILQKLLAHMKAIEL